MISVNRRRWRIRGSIRERLIEVRGRCGSGSRGDDERLDIKASDEPFESDAVAVGLDVTLIPGEAKRCFGYLDHEKVEVRVWRGDPRP